MRSIACWILLVFVTMVSAQTEKRDPKVVTGIVLDSATGQPLRGARVEIIDVGYRLEDKREPIVVTTGEDGRFTLTLAPDSLGTITAIRRGYRSEDRLDVAMVGMEWPEGREAQDLKIKLVPLGTIVGRVTNPEGEGVPGILVEAMVGSVSDGQRQYLQHESKRTDDRGEFRFWYLSPGDYYVRAMGYAGSLVAVGDMSMESRNWETYPPSYYLDSATLEGAMPVEVSAGTTSQVLLKVTAQPSFTVRGKLLGAPKYQHVQTRLMRGDDEIGIFSLVNGATGEFAMDLVPAGEYVVQAWSPGSKRLTVGEAPVRVSNQNVTGVTIQMSEGSEVVVSTRTAGNGRLSGLTAIPTDPLKHPPGFGRSWASLGPGGTCKFTGLQAGRYFLRPQIEGDAYVESMTSGGRDVMAEGIQVGSGGAVQVEITLAAGGASVEGTVQIRPGEAEHSVAFLRLTGSTVFPTVVTANEKGEFTAKNLPPGDYLVVEWSGDGAPEYLNPKVLQSLGTTASRITLIDGARSQIRLRPTAGEVR